MKLIRFYTLVVLSFLSFSQVQAQNASLCVPAQIEVREGNTTITCEPGAPMEIRFRTSRVNTPYGFAITHPDGTILRVSISDRVSFRNLPGGQLRVYAFSYIGLVTAEEGDNIFGEDLASVCSAVSSNYIEVLNIVPEGGNVTSTNGRTAEYICTDDELTDILSFQTSEVDEPIYAYLVTDEENKLLSISESGTIDFTNMSVEVSRVWGIAYTGDLTVEPGQDITLTNLAEGCYDVSDDFVSVINTQPEGATITANGSTDDVQACDYPEATNVQITLANNNDQSFEYAYILSDEAETTFTVVEGNTINLSELPMGNSRVRGISFVGELAADSGTYPDFTDAGTGCFDLSDNYITLTRIFVEGGTVALADGSTEVRPCGIDELPDEFSFQTTSTAEESYAWILTGDNNFIKGIYTDNLISIDEFDDEDNFRVRGLSYRGEILPVLGQELKEAELVDGCYQVSENFVTITRIRPEGGSVALADGSVNFSGCDSPDTFGQTILDLSNTGDAEFSYTYLLTDTDDNILQIITEEAIPLSELPKGTSRIWGINYEGELTAQVGDNVGAIVPVDGCYDLSDNFIEVERIIVDGGELTILDGSSEALTCGNDDIPDAFTFTSTTTATDQSYVLVVTDVNNRVFSTVNGGIIDFDLFAPRTYRIWGLSYTGTLNVPFGSILTEIVPSDGCYDLSNSFATIRQEEVNGGQLQFTGGGTEKFTCPGDGNPDVLSYLNNGFSSDSYVYLITDPNNVILATTTDSSFDFDAAAEGICRIWGLAYSGTLNAPVGSQADTLLFSDECYSLSENFLTVVRQPPVGGTIDLVNGGDTVFTCPGDGMADMLEFTTSSTYPGVYIYLITHEDNRVVDVSFTGKYDFDFAEPGNCRVYGVAFTGNWIIQAGSLITEEALSDDCWELSDNYITVIREAPTAGTLTFGDGSDTQYTCPGDGRADLFEFNTTSEYPGSFIYLITDENNQLLTTTTDPSFDFDDADLGTCRVYGVAYTGALLVQTGDDVTLANLSDDCFDLSTNFLSIIKDTPDAGVISTPDGNMLTLCVGDAISDVVQLNVEGASNSQYAYLITDENGFLISPIVESEFDFNNAVGGICRIYGMAYTGEIIGVPGDNINDIPLSSDCFSISESFITLNRLSVDGSTIFTGSGSTDFEYVCSGDGIPDPITFDNGNDDPQVSYQYLITTPTNSILGEVNGNTLDVEGSPFDTLRIWGVAYIGNPTLPIGMDITAAMLSDSCYDRSDNFITIVNGLPEGGMVSSADGSVDLRVCIGGTSGLVDFTNTSTSLLGYTYIVTTPDLEIVGSAEAGTVDFNTYEIGDYLVHGLSFSGSLIYEAGDTLDQVELASSCYELSTNSVQVERTPPLDGGSITSAFGDPLYVCLNDGMGDIGAFETSSTDPNYRYVITDTLNNILLPDLGGNIVDFNQGDPGFFRVWGVSFTGNFIGGFGADILEDQLTDRCHAVSSNYVTLVIEEFIGGTVSTGDGETEISIVSGDGIEDVITFDSTGTSGISYAYIITDENDAIQEILTGDSFDFEGTDEGISRVWGLSYSGEILASAGDTLTQVLLTTGCSELSDNFVAIEKVGPPSPYAIQIPFNTVSERLKLQLYPNPVSQTLNIHLKALFEDVELEGNINIEVFDLSGRRLIGTVENMVEQVSTFSLDVQELPIGMYVLRVTNDGVSAQQRFFRQ